MICLPQTCVFNRIRSMTYIPDLKESAGENLQILQMFGTLTKSFDVFKKKNKYDVGPAVKTKWSSYRPLSSFGYPSFFPWTIFKWYFLLFFFMSKICTICKLLWLCNSPQINVKKMFIKKLCQCIIFLKIVHGSLFHTVMPSALIHIHYYVSEINKRIGEMFNLVF